MCSLCGVLGGRGHWTDTTSNPEAFRNRPATTLRRERQARTRLANTILKHYGLGLADWGGNAYVLRGRTGQTALIDNLTELWPVAENFAKQPCDPLDEGLLAALAKAGRQ